MAQQSAVAEAHAAAEQQRRSGVMGKWAGRGGIAVDPLGNPLPESAGSSEQPIGTTTPAGQIQRLGTASDQRTAEIQSVSAAKRSAIEAREKRLAAQAEAERQRLLETLRQR
jgi:hypothetical protein